MFPGALGFSNIGQALARGDWSLDVLNIRSFAIDKHQRVDDTPYGGGAGMVMKPDVLARAIEAAYTIVPDATLIYPSPRGTLFTQPVSENLHAQGDLIFLCGRFEGIDERILTHYQPLHISLGDYILCGGELAAMVMMEATLRHLPGLLGNPQTHAEESFAIGQDCAGLLEYPHYTKPPIWNGYAVPDILTSGNHAHIEAWRRKQAEIMTKRQRHDLWEKYSKTDI